MYHHITQFAFYGFAFADIFVKWLAMVFERAVHRRKLPDFSAKPVQHCFGFCLSDINRALCRDLTFGIAGGGGLSQAQQGTIGLVGIKQGIGEFRGFSEADRQKSGCERVERAGVPGLFGLKQAADFLQSSVRA